MNAIVADSQSSSEQAIVCIGIITFQKKNFNISQEITEKMKIDWTISLNALQVSVTTTISAI